MDAWYLEARRGLRSVERARLLERRQLARRAVVGVHRHAAHRRLGRSLPGRLGARITPDGVGSGRSLAIKIAGRPRHLYIGPGAEGRAARPRLQGFQPPTGACGTSRAAHASTRTRVLSDKYRVANASSIQRCQIGTEEYVAGRVGCAVPPERPKPCADALPSLVVATAQA